ncbi:hypothetical protein [Vibrio cholerae]|uniref:hypothetical protein n=1 Tax=Vibrio cholerae TaxID=666 RepID=UPI003080D14D
MEPNDVLALVFSGVGSLFICAYYMNRNKSTCCECKEVISHQKQNRYHLEKDGEKFAICKRCCNRLSKLGSLNATQCSCCGKAFSKRMKILEWQGEHKTYFLCISCNGKASHRMSRNFVANDVFPPEFIQSCSNYESFEHLAKSSGLKLQTQSDFDKADWERFIQANTSFSSWGNMKKQAEKKVLQKQNDSIVKTLMKKNV